jgi:hypothetical protein
MDTGGATLGIHCPRIARNRLLTMITMTCAMFSGTSPIAIGSSRSPTLAKHQKIPQLESCMKAQMSASKTIFYNEAEKVCKDQIEKQRNNSASGALVASDAPAKQ